MQLSLFWSMSVGGWLAGIWRSGRAFEKGNIAVDYNFFKPNVTIFRGGGDRKTQPSPMLTSPTGQTSDRYIKEAINISIV